MFQRVSKKFSSLQQKTLGKMKNFVGLLYNYEYTGSVQNGNSSDKEEVTFLLNNLNLSARQTLVKNRMKLND